MKQPTIASLGALAAALALGTALAGCGRQQDRSTDPRGADQATDAGSARDDAQAKARPAANAIRSAAQLTNYDAGDRVADAAITASINAEFARDPQLSAQAIDVDTVSGHVTLHGSAPSDAARDHASRLASTVHGVASVDNELSVQP